MVLLLLASEIPIHPIPSHLMEKLITHSLTYIHVPSNGSLDVQVTTKCHLVQISCYHITCWSLSPLKKDNSVLQPQRAWIKPSLSQKSSRGVRIRHETYEPGLSLNCCLFVKSLNFAVLGLWGPRSVALFVEGHSGNPWRPEVTLASTARN